jgi:carbon-monoxide dehydrogenase medium subunit
MVIPDFTYYKPETLKDAIRLLEGNNNSVLMAGGTDLLVEIKKGLRTHEDVISLSGIAVLKVISENDHEIFIGSGITHSELITSPIISADLQALADAASKIGSHQVRNTGTIGGNLCTAASCCDTAPILLALNARLEIADKTSVRTLPLKDFFVFNKKTILKKGEIVTRVIIPRPDEETGAHYEKFGLREAGSISVVSVAVMVKLHNGTITDCCIVIGAVAPQPKISNGATMLLKGKKVSDLFESSPVLEEIGQAAADDSIPIDDIRGGAQYRRDILKVLTRRAVVKAIGFAEAKRLKQSD